MRSNILPLFALVAAAASITLPSDIGPYGTHITAQELTDTNRIDPYAPDGRHRRLMLSLISPTHKQDECTNGSSRYMPDLTANFYDQLYAPITQNGTFESFELQTCDQVSHRSRHHLAARNVQSEWKLTNAGPDRPALPVAIFSPGYGNSRLLYTALCQSIASYGVHVITIDHPYDALGVEYPDGTYVLATENFSTDEQLEQDIGVRTDDVEFIVKSLTDGILTLPGVHASHSPIVMFGHSLGGATALSAMLREPRIRAGVNMDGKFFPAALSSSAKLDKPFLLVGNEGRNTSTDSTWDLVVQKYLTHPQEVQLAGTEHGSFTDLPLLIEALGIDLKVLAGSENGIGSVPGSEMVKILAGLLMEFFKTALREETV